MKLNKVTQYTLALLIGLLTVMALFFPLVKIEQDGSTFYLGGIQCLLFSPQVIYQIIPEVVVIMWLGAFAMLLVGVWLCLSAWRAFANGKQKEKKLTWMAFLCLGFTALYTYVGTYMSGAFSNVSDTGLSIFPCMAVLILLFVYLICVVDGARKYE